MKFLQSRWFYIIAAAITIFGLITGRYLFLLLVFPLGLFNLGKKKDQD